MNEEEKQIIKYEEHLIPFVERSLVLAAQEYIETVGLPKEALPSVISAAQTKMALEKIVNEQRALPDEARRELISSSQSITEPLLAKADEVVATTGFPYHALYITKDSQVGVKAMGWRLKGRSDPRIIKEWSVIERRVEELPDGSRRYVVEKTLHFWNGESYTSIGSCSSAEPLRRDAPASILEMIAETRAETRALRSALGLPFEIAEDLEDTERRRFVEVGPSERSEEWNFLRFIRECRRELGLGAPEAANLLGVPLEQLPFLGAFEQHFARLREILAAKSEGEG